MLFSYLKQNRMIMLMTAVFIIVFAVVFSLYDLPLEAVVYAAALCASAWLLLFIFGYLKFRRRHMLLENLKESISISLDGLPKPQVALEGDYQELLHRLFTEKSRIENESRRSRRETEDYYAMWAHQIKTPIAAMRLLLQETHSAENATLLAELFSVEQYVEMVLSYLRLNSDSSDLLLRQYKLDDIIRKAAREYAKLFIIKKLSFDFRETGLTVLTDEKWLLFVIEQILSNAIKYTRKGKIFIYAEESKLIIEDTGIGVRQEDLPRVFEKGFTGYNGRENTKSTGIGLYLCRAICTKLGHTIRMESELGKGTRVIIDLSVKERMYE